MIKRGILFIVLLVSLGLSMTFPIDLADCKIKHGRVELTGWYSQSRGSNIHAAIDIPCERGTDVKAVKSGIVIEKGYRYPRYVNGEWADNYGNYIVIQDEDGYRWLYGHLEYSTVNPGDRIKEGQIVAKAGSTGLVYSTGQQRFATHLHIEKQNNKGRKLNFTVELGRSIKPYLKDQTTPWAFTLRG